MNSLLSKTEKFLKVGPYLLWFGLNTVIVLLLGVYAGMPQATYYLVIFFGFTTLLIWFFGFQVFPRYLSMKEGKEDEKFALYLTINILIFLTGIGIQYLARALFGLEFLRIHPLPTIIRVSIWTLFVFLGVSFTAGIQLARVYHQDAVQKIGYKAERIKAELQLLKNQISPHFLFNTLNNIYGLAYMKDERAAQMISKLSQIMRYLLDDCDQPTVPLVKERDLLEHYLNLQLLKHEGSRNVDFYHAGVNHSHTIVPMILINFVENCFKHSDLDTNHEGWIKIDMEVENNELTFQTENTVKKEVEKILFDRKGIGLTNSLKLLEANYPEKHMVEINKDDETYQLKVTLKL